MSNFYIPEGYQSHLDLYNTQVAIKTIKDFFESLIERIKHGKNGEEGEDEE